MNTRKRETMTGARNQGSGARGQGDVVAWASAHESVELRPAWAKAHATSRRRSGFTLVELLVVITIIIILMGLLTPVVMIALGRAKEGRITLEIATLDGAMKAYKEKHGSYPPSDFVNIGTSGSPQNIALANHLAKAFPRCNVTTEINAILTANPKGTSPAQAITFWLSGFCTDVEQPISGIAKGLPREAPLFEFDRTRLRAIPGAASAVYDAADTPGVPYVYFAAQNYNTHVAAYSGALGTSASPGTPFDTSVWGQGGAGLVRPYAADPYSPPYSATVTPTPVNPNSFQIISAGLDGDFGKGGIDDAGSHDPTYVVAYFKQGNFYATGDKDNLTNFSDRTLGDAIPK
jgi:prepilin-type N-terminal cleavage/methylation domain-containing protein